MKFGAAYRAFSNAPCLLNDIRAVVFDLGGVLVTSPMKSWQKFEKSRHLKPNSISTILHMRMMDQFYQLERGEITLPEFERAFSAEYSKRMPCNEVLIPFISNWEATLTQYPVMIEFVKKLRATGLKTALLTNNYFSDEAKGKSHMPLDHSLFDVILESARVGIRKPDAEIFYILLDKLKVEPKFSVFFDDVKENIEAASKIGMKTIKVIDSAQAISDFKKLLSKSLKKQEQIFDKT